MIKTPESRLTHRLSYRFLTIFLLTSNEKLELFITGRKKKPQESTRVYNIANDGAIKISNYLMTVLFCYNENETDDSLLTQNTHSVIFANSYFSLCRLRKSEIVKN